ncbi:hypothetical protein KBD08_03485 [Candidatus Babeliales bacterium]|nr:hypothetical protein [Candidatus Babeliales bacterium]
MSHPTLKSFIELVTFDRRILENTSSVQKTELALKALQDQQGAFDAQFQLQVVKKNELHKTLQEQEVLVQESQDREQRLTNQIERISSSKEYDAGMKELNQLKFDRNQQEQKLVSLTNRMQNAEKEFQVAQQAQEQQKEATAALVHEQEQKLNQLHNDLEVLQAERSAKLVGVPLDWLEIYELMRGRVPDPVVPLQQNSCSVCFYGFTPRDLQTVKEKHLIQCKDCYRFLYEDTAS